MRFLSRLRQLVFRVRLRCASPYRRARLFRKQGATIGEGCRLLTRDLGSEPWLVEIGDRTLVSYGVEFITHDGAAWVLRDRLPYANRFGRVVVGDESFIGARAILLPGTRIGDRCVVGAGAVVKGEYPQGSVIAGVPARVIGSVDDYERRVMLETLDLPAECFPLDSGNRNLLRRAVTDGLDARRH